MPAQFCPPSKSITEQWTNRRTNQWTHPFIESWLTTKNGKKWIDSQNHGAQAILVLLSFCLTQNWICMDKSTHVVFRSRKNTDKKRSHNSYQKANTVQTSRACDIAVLTSSDISMVNMRVKYFIRQKTRSEHCGNQEKKLLSQHIANPIDPPLFPLTFRLGTLMVTNWRHAYMVVVGNIVIIKLKCRLF